jgi:hypothetical protein
LRHNVTQSVVFTTLADQCNQSKVSRFHSTPAPVNSVERLGLDGYHDISTEDRYSTTTKTVYSGEMCDPLPWDIRSKLNAEIQASKINKHRRHLARLEEIREVDKQLKVQNDSRRVKTKSKLRHMYYKKLKEASDHIKPISKILNDRQQNRHFGTSKESMFYNPIIEHYKTMHVYTHT